MQTEITEIDLELKTILKMDLLFRFWLILISINRTGVSFALKIRNFEYIHTEICRVLKNTTVSFAKYIHTILDTPKNTGRIQK